MKRYFIVVLLLAVFASNKSFAQTDEPAAIKATINLLFEGMRKNDSTIARKAIHPTCFLKSVGKTKEGIVKLQNDGVDAWLKSIATPRGVMLDERLLSYDIKIDGDMAIAWTPYKFYLGEKFNHCGVNVFTLMKTSDKGWQIIGIVDTRRKEGCE
ncbi:MAG: hypothetical protein ACK4NY_23030 [Spirosomataceae bacterium]